MDDKRYICRNEQGDLVVNIFTFINDILYKKKGDLLNDGDAETVFVPYMMSRWTSMYSSSMAKLINQTFNRLWPAFDNKDMWYKAFVTVLPKSKFKKIAYIKKNKEAKETKKNSPERKLLIEYLAKNMEMSKREIKEILDNHDVDIAKCIKAIK